MSGNIVEMLGLAGAKEAEAVAHKEHFVVWEGDPFAIGGRASAVVGAGLRRSRRFRLGPFALFFFFSFVGDWCVG